MNYIASYNHMNGSHKHNVEPKKSDAKGYIFCDLLYIKF